MSSQGWSSARHVYLAHYHSCGPILSGQRVSVGREERPSTTAAANDQRRTREGGIDYGNYSAEEERANAVCGANYGCSRGCSHWAAAVEEPPATASAVCKGFYSC